MSFEDWVRNGWASQHKSTRPALRDSETPGFRRPRPGELRHGRTGNRLAVRHCVQFSPAISHGGACSRRLPGQPRGAPSSRDPVSGIHDRGRPRTDSPL